MQVGVSLVWFCTEPYRIGPEKLVSGIKYCNRKIGNTETGITDFVWVGFGISVSQTGIAKILYWKYKPVILDK